MENKKKPYVKPTIEVLLFEEDDVITTSGVVKYTPSGYPDGFDPSVDPDDWFKS